MLISRTEGSYFFLAVLLSTARLQYDMPIERDHCGGCKACLDACPTDAFPKPFVLDASRCISYLTIEHREAIKDELKPGIGDWVFGCDICQDVCPWNHRGALSNEREFEAVDQHNRLNLRSLFTMDDEQFRSTFRKTPLWRTKRDGMLRNAAIALETNEIESIYLYCNLLWNSLNPRWCGMPVFGLLSKLNLSRIKRHGDFIYRSTSTTQIRQTGDRLSGRPGCVVGLQ